MARTKTVVTSEAEEQINTECTEQQTLIAELSEKLNDPSLDAKESTEVLLELQKAIRDSVSDEKKEEMRLYAKEQREKREKAKKKKDAILKGVRQAQHRVKLIVSEIVLTAEGKTEETIIAETTKPLINAKGNFVKNTVVFDRFPSEQEKENGDAEKDADGFWKIIKEHSVCDKRIWNATVDHNTNKALEVMFDAQIRMCAKGQAQLRKMPTVLADAQAGKPEAIADEKLVTGSQRAQVDAQRQELQNKASQLQNGQ